MRVMVTGVAGFIGDHVAGALGRGGHEVHGVDSLTPFYDPATKRRNLQEIAGFCRSITLEDVRAPAVLASVGDVDAVVHLAGQPGVRSSWGRDFRTYVDLNVVMLQELLEAAAKAGCRRFVFGSSSSVYGDTSLVGEGEKRRPVSPYGVSKAAGEDLCRVYGESFGLPTVSLRLFTVYGPRQRPDMAAHGLIRAALANLPFQVFGDGKQRRRLTYVGDVAAAFTAALSADVDPGDVFDVAGDEVVSTLDLVDAVERATGRTIDVVSAGMPVGDPFEIAPVGEDARRALDWHPRTTLEDGIALQVAWQRRVAGGRCASSA